jgi:mannose-1-phosphate guanylyltransferase/phosphomannomutase
MVLGAGEAERLRPLSLKVPKPLMPVGNRPCMEHVLRWLARHGVREVIVNLYHLPEHIKKYFGDGQKFGVSLAYSEEEELLGTAGGVKRASHFFTETFVVVGSDDLTDIDLGRVVEFHRKSGALATIAATEVEDVSEYGICETDESGRIKRYLEKPTPEQTFSHLANTAVYVFEPGIFDFVPSVERPDFSRHVFPLLLERGAPFFALRRQEYWKDIGRPSDLLQANMDVLTRRCSSEPAGIETVPGIWIGEACAADPTAFLEPPVCLGSGATVGQKVRLGPCVAIGNESHASAKSHLANCVVFDDTIVPRNTTLESAVVGPDGEIVQV